MRPSRMTTTRLQAPDQLGELRRDEDHALALLGELLHEPVDLVLALDVDAVGRLVEDEDVGARVEPLGQHDLLLVAAREVAHRVLDVGDLDVRGARRAPSCALRSAAIFGSGSRSAAVALERRAGSCSCEREKRLDRALVAAVLGQQHDAGLEALARGCGSLSSSPCTLTVPSVARSAPKMARTSSVRREPTSPAMPSSSPLRSSKLASIDAGRRGEVLHLQELLALALDLARLAALRRRVERPGDLLDQLGHRHVLRARVVDDLAVAHHAHEVGQLEDLVQPVAHVDDRHAVVAQRSGRRCAGA